MLLLKTMKEKNMKNIPNNNGLVIVKYNINM